MTETGGSGIHSTGQGTHGGGGNAVHAPGSGVGDVGTTLRLAIDEAVLATLTEAELRAVAIAQLRYARDVAAAAVAGYDGVLAVLARV